MLVLTRIALGFTAPESVAIHRDNTIALVAG